MQAVRTFIRWIKRYGRDGSGEAQPGRPHASAEVRSIQLDRVISQEFNRDPSGDFRLESVDNDFPL